MKLFVKLLIAVLVIGILLPFTILKGKDGRPLMSFDDVKVPGKTAIPKLTPGIETNTTIYEWKDNDGNIQFSTSPPAAGVEYTAKEYDPNTNVIQAVKLPESDTDEAETEKENNTTPVEEIGSTYSPDNIKKLIDDAKNVENLLNDRFEKQKAIIGD